MVKMDSQVHFNSYSYPPIGCYFGAKSMDDGLSFSTHLTIFAQTNADLFLNPFTQNIQYVFSGAFTMYEKKSDVGFKYSV